LVQKKQQKVGWFFFFLISHLPKKSLPTGKVFFFFGWTKTFRGLKKETEIKVFSEVDLFFFSFFATWGKKKNKRPFGNNHKVEENP
jgi:hypothetical protein